MGQQLLRASAFVRDLAKRGGALRASDGDLLCTPPEGGLTPGDLSFVREHREALLSLASAARVDAAAIPPRDHDAGRVTSSGQERLWVLAHLEEVGGAYNQAMAVRLRGTLSTEALEAAFTAVLERHEVLRSRYPAQGGAPVAQVLPPSGVRVPVEDLTDLGTSAPAEARARACDLVAQPFDLGAGPLIRLRLYRVGRDDHLLAIALHHIVSDGWSWSVLLRELMALYRERVTGERAELPTLPIGYFDFAAWDRSRVERLSGSLEADVAYWRTQLADAPVLDLPASGPRPVVQSHRGDTVTFAVPPTLKARLEELGRQNGATLFMAMLGLFQALLARYAGQKDVVVGIPEAGRVHPDTEGLIGFFAHTVPIRTAVGDELSFAELLRKVRDTVLDAISHASAPFDLVVDALNVKRDLSRSPVFQVLFSFEAIDPPPLRFPGLEAWEEPLARRAAMFDMTLWVNPEGQGLRCEIDYCVDLFERGFAERLARHYIALMERAADTPEEPLVRLPLLDQVERRGLLALGAGPHSPRPGDGTFLDWVHEQARAAPARVAVQDDVGDSSYGEIWATAGRVATGLAAHGVARGDVVGVHMERGARMLSVLLGILRRGAAYLPLDPAFPEERLRYMVRDAGATLVVADSASVTFGDSSVATPDSLVASAGGGLDALEVTADDLAYVIYTSGSTGRPKGVEVTHGALRNFLESMRTKPGLAPEDVLLSVTTLSFDIAGLELFLPLCVGARVVVPPHAVTSNGYRLAEWLERHRPTVMQATPATWRMLVDAGWRGPLAKALCGGDTLGAELARELVERADVVWNLYGPTETTIWSTLAEVSAGQPVTVGSAIANTRVYVLDPWRNLVPRGVVGDIWIGGAGVARGYRARPELTAERFVADPFVPHGRMYRTGDVGRWREDGTLEHLGRQDFQVKVNGFRIELGEIEAALEGLEEVRQAVVLVRGAADDPRLVGYVAFHEGSELLAGEVRQVLADTLPQYMVPGVIVPLASFPLTPNGKIDRNALPDPLRATARSRVHEEPTGPVEEPIAGVWRELLGLERVGRHDNFFELGGHSLLALRAAADLVRRFGVEIDPRWLFFRTLAQVAESASLRSDHAAGVVA